ncbi:MAG TPA: ATP-binding protein, partial [Burkholderiales bacterium]|nr:ATP-binding protein [Burkholderiales bacterium]
SCTQNFLRTGRSANRELRVTGESVFVYADPHRMTQVLTNLLDNALKFTPPGGRIVVSDGSEGAEAVLRVADTGSGIPPEALSRIFDVFAQGDQALDRAHGGLGLGLALAKSLVEMHHGRIVAESEGPGTGTVFTIRLPRAQHGTPASEHEEHRKRPPDFRGRRVLIVEDQADTRQALRSLLELAGHQVVESSDGQSAVEVARGAGVDVALIDLGLPGMDGFDVARAFLSDAGLRSVRLVALTGYSRPEDREKAREAGFHDFVIKPIEETTLRRVLA